MLSILENVAWNEEKNMVFCKYLVGLFSLSGRLVLFVDCVVELFEAFQKTCLFNQKFLLLSYQVCCYLPMLFLFD